MLAKKRGVWRGGQMTPKLLEIFSLDFLGHLYMSEKTRVEFSKKSHFWNTLMTNSYQFRAGWGEFWNAL